MRAIIFLGLILTLSVVSCKDHHSHYRENAPPRRYKDHKNKRGIGDYPLGIPFGGPSFHGFQSPTPAATSFPGYGGFSGYTGGSPLAFSSSPFGLPSQSSPTFSSLGSHALGNLGGYNLGQSLNIGQGSGYSLQSSSPSYGLQSSSSGYSLPSSSISLASLLGGQTSGQSSYSSPSLGLFTPSEKTGPVTFAAQASNTGQSQQQYTPVYATATQLGSSNYAVPVVMTPSHGSGNYQGYSLPVSALKSLGSQGISISSLTSGNGVSYNYPSSSSGSSSHAVSGGYVVSAPQQSGSSSSYSISVPAVSSSSSSPSYTISVPSSSYSSPSASTTSSSSSSTYQLPIMASAYTSSPPSSSSGGYAKYTPASSEGSTYASNDQLRSHGNALKVSSFTSPSTSYEGPSSSSNGYSGSVSTNYASVPSYSSGNSGASSSVQALHPVTSYGTPATSYSIPSTSYGTPSNGPSISSLNYNSHSSSHTSPSINYASAAAANNGVSASSYNTPSSNSYQADSSYKVPNTNYGSPAGSYTGTSTSYGSPSNGPSIELNSNYKSPLTSSTASLSNSIESSSSHESAETYDSPVDSGSSYSNHSPRYLRYPAIRTLSPYLDSEESTNSGSSYDTISYSVANGKY